jgi:hypothetical protein
VKSANSITAVSPAETAGTVDVSVTTPGGTCAISVRNDRFKFLSPTDSESHRTPRETAVSPDDEYTTVAAAGATATGGVPGFGALMSAPTATRKVSLRGRNIMVQSHSQAAVKVVGTDPGQCSRL